MSFTFLAKSLAYSWKISFAGQVLCQRIEIGPCAFAIIGTPSAAAPPAVAAPVRNLRREACGLSCWVFITPPAFGEGYLVDARHIVLPCPAPGRACGGF